MVVAGRDEDECLDALPLERGAVEAVKRIDKHIESLVSPLIASAYPHENGIVRDCLARHSRRYLDKLRPGGRPELLIFFIGGRGEVILEPVRSNDVHIPLEELLALLCSDLAHRGEDIRVLGRLLLEGMTGKHIEIPCLGISIVQRH